MPKIIFTEEFCKPQNLHPFTLTRQIQDIRIGILTIREKWEKALGFQSYDKFEDDHKDLENCIRIDQSIPKDTYYLLHGNLLPTSKLVKAIKTMKPGELITMSNKETVAYCFTKDQVLEDHKIAVKKERPVGEEAFCISYPWNIFQQNDRAIKSDFELVTHKRKSRPISKSNRLVNKKNIFFEAGVQVENVVIDATQGPVYVGKDAVIMDGSLIKGPVSIGSGAVLKMGTRAYGATTIGPGCVVGGEIKNSVLFAHSNKAHDGYLGDSVIGAWCNLGAGTSNSNMKNNAGVIRIPMPGGNMEVGNKCGCFMGDYTKTAINTSINTGTVIGVGCNVFGNGLTPKYIPNFSWGSEGVKKYEFDKAVSDFENWKKLKGKTFTPNELSILKYIYEHY